MNKRQSGFALVEGLLIILILAIIGFGGYYVWHSQKSIDKTNADTLKASQSSASTASTSSSKKILFANGTISLKLPIGWQEGGGDALNNCQTSNTDRGSDGLPCLGGEVLFPAGSATNPNNLETIHVSTYTLVGSSNPKQWFFDDFWGSSGAAPGDTAQNLKINGYDAYYYEQNNSTDGAYIDENYTIIHNNKVVYLWSRIKEASSNSDFTKDKPLIKDLAYSVQIN